MRSKIIAAAVVVLTPTATGLAWAPPASGAVSSVCAGTAQAVLSQGLLYPLTPSNSTTGTTNTTTLEGVETASFAVSLVTGACVPGGSLNALGTYTGYCGHGVGFGVTMDGHHFGFTVAGPFLVVTGGLTGVIHATPNPLVPGNSCAEPGSASVFILVGSVAKCTPATLTSLTTVSTAVPLTPTQNLTTAGTTLSNHTTVKPQSVYATAHVCI